MESNFEKTVIKIGTITVLMALVANYIPVLFLWIAYGAVPPMGDLLMIWAMMLAAFGTSWFVQPISYFGALGAAGSYISWTAGSAAGCRVPAISMAHRVTGTEANTPAGDALGLMALGASVFVTVAITTIFTIIGAGILPFLPEPIKISFNYMLPALFAAVYANLALKHIKLGVWTLAVVFIIFYVYPYTGLPGSLLTLVQVLMGTLVGYVLYLRLRKQSPAE